MNDSQVKRLLRLYPPQWRARYGDELADLIAESTGGERMTWRSRVDVVAGAVRERVRAAGLGRGGAAHRRAVGAITLALGAWWLFLVAAIALVKFSEHWRDAVPGPHRAAPSVAYDITLTAAAAAGVIVLVGAGLAARSFAVFLRAGGWRSIRSVVLSAAALTVAAVAALAGLVLWARRLDATQRAGHDLGYAAAFVAVGALCALALLGWTIAGIRTARRLPLSAALLRIESWLLCALAIMMSAVVASAVVWWVDRASAWPPIVASTPGRSTLSPLAALLLAAGAAMFVATAVAVFAAAHAVRAVHSDAAATPLT